MSRSVVYTLHLWPSLGHAGHYTGSAIERRLAQRLTDHALGRGARLTQVQVERGGTWVLAQTQPSEAPGGNLHPTARGGPGPASGRVASGPASLARTGPRDRCGS